MKSQCFKTAKKKKAPQKIFCLGDHHVIFELL